MTLGETEGEQSRWARAAVASVERRCEGAPLDRSLRITLNFHPDREVAGVGTLEAIAADGRYRSQFETGTSNGGLTAHRGGDRWRWERELFAGAYDDAPAAERPKYGALDHARRPLGGAPRFGAAHLRLREHVLDRATFCFPDSALGPVAQATAHRFGLFPLLAEHEGDPMDGYIEAQVHGPVLLASDVEALVLDPCFAGTPIEAFAVACGTALEWHEGRVLTVAELQARPDYRGPEAVSLGAEIARDGRLDARLIGNAARTGRHHPQRLKQLWHHVAQWGSPA